MRPSWDQYFLGMLDSVSARASCNRGKSGAILVRHHRIIGTGYVGAPIGLPSCDEVGHQMITVFENGERSDHCVRTFHAELNAILSCAKEGISTVNATMYCTMVPCRMCAMAIIQAGIICVVAKNRYQKDGETRDLFKKTGVRLIVLSENVLY